MVSLILLAAVVAGVVTTLMLNKSLGLAKAAGAGLALTVVLAALSIVALISRFATQDTVVNGPCDGKQVIARPGVTDPAQLMLALFGTVREGRAQWVPVDPRHEALIDSLEMTHGEAVSTSVSWVGELRFAGLTHRVMATATVPADGGFDAPGSAPAVGLVVLEEDDSGVCVLLEDLAITHAGALGVAPVPTPFSFSDSQSGLLYQTEVQAQGYEVGVARIISVVTGVPSVVLDTLYKETNAGLCGEGEPCWGYEATLEAQGEGPWGDVLFKARGNHMPDALLYTEQRRLVFDGSVYTDLADQPASGPGTAVSMKRLVAQGGRCEVREALGDGGHPIELPEEVTRRLDCGAPNTALSPDHRLLLWLEDDTVLGWDFTTGQKLALWQLPHDRRGISGPAFSPDGRRFAYVLIDWQGPLVTVFDVEAGLVRRQLALRAPVRARCDHICSVDIGVDLLFAERGSLLYQLADQPLPPDGEEAPLELLVL